MRRLLVLLTLSVLCVPAFAQSGLIISEYVEGSSNNKAIEIYNGSGGPVNIGNYQLKMYFNGSASVGLTVSMAGQVPAGGVYVVVHAQADPVLLAKGNVFNAAGWFNGDDAVVLTRASDNAVIDSIGQIGFDPGSEWGTGLVSTADNTLRRKFSVTTGDTNPSNVFDPSIQWDGFATNTFTDVGFHNIVIPPPPPVTVREIYEIQGSGAASAYAGQVVETRDNIVTAVGNQGFFIQTPDYRVDNDAATSNGIYVFTGNTAAVAVGDQVDVKGDIAEFFNFTEFSGSITITVDGHGFPLPSYFQIPAGYSNFERLEGMLVRVTNGTATSGTDQFSETTIVASSSRPFRTAGVNGGNYPDIIDVDPTGLGGAAQQIVGGANIVLAEGPLAFDFGDYSIWSTSLQYTNPAFPRPVRARNAGELTVAGQNLLRLFDDVDDPALGEPVTATAAYQARLTQISHHIRVNLGAPDVLAVSEVENISTLMDLAQKVNFDQAGLNYAAYLEEGNDIGGIDVGFLVRDTVAVDSIEQLGAGDTWIDPQTNAAALLNDRPALLLRGSYIGNGAAFAINVIAVHQRSLIDVETSARVRAKREAQAENLADHIQAVQSADPDARLVVTGDFNAFEFDDGYVDVMGILTSEANLTNQVLTVAAGDRYSYVHEGVAQVLDHSLTSLPLNSWVRELQWARANADSPVAFAPASDHDGVVLFVMTDHDGDGYADDNDTCATGDARPTVILDGCDSGAPNLMFEDGCSLTDKIVALHATAKNHGQFMAAVGKLINGLKKGDELTGEQKGAITACAGQWN
ncbi:MAG TPA: lamin tail domain-containing protein [Thermoanaerobaculia bacterium]|nr:lamin tail domain-containing protein [Thermoanaerobaculia bacterium]